MPAPTKILFVEMSRSLEEGPPWSALRIARAMDPERRRFVFATTPGLAAEFRGRNLWDGPLRAVEMPRLKVTPNPAWWAGFITSAPRAARALEKIIAEEKPDLVLINSIINIYAGIAAARRGVPVLWYVREILPRRFMDDLYCRWAAKRAKYFIAVSEAAKRRLAAAGVPARRVRVIHNAVSAGNVTPEEVGRLRDRLNLSDAGPIIGFVSNIEERKGHHVLVESLPKLLKEFPNLKVLAAGKAGGESLSYEQSLKRRIRELGLDNAYLMIGARENVFPVYALADLVVQPSVFQDPLPRTVIEAASMGRAVVGANVGGIPEMIRDDATGLIVPPGDARALADAILSLLRDPERLNAMGAAARELARREFSPEALAEKLDALIVEILGEKGSPASNF